MQLLNEIKVDSIATITGVTIGYFVTGPESNFHFLVLNSPEDFSILRKN